MYFFIKKIKISNFLSFFGEYEVNLKPFSAIMCNFHEGKDDLFRVFEFAFGAKLCDLRVKSALELVHVVLREEMQINNDIKSYVEITLDLFQEKRQMKFYRGIKNGKLHHKLEDVFTSGSLYEEKLKLLGIHIKHKNIIFYKTYFNNVIWGTSEDLEKTVCTCMREAYLLEEWEELKKEVDCLIQRKRRTAGRDFQSVRRSQSVIAKFARKYEAVADVRETMREEILLDTPDTASEDSFTTQPHSETKTTLIKSREKKWDVFKLETEISLLTNTLADLDSKEAQFTSRLYYEEIRLASKPVNASVLQNRISQIKLSVAEKETQMAQIWRKIVDVKSEVEKLSQSISFTLVSLQEIQNSNYLQNRFTSYGRFHDYLEPGPYVPLLKQIIGEDIFYANLCDSIESAFSTLSLIKYLNYEHREVFICFENYSHRLKDVLTASGEKGVQMKTLEQLLIFLCKLKHYGLIDEVPVMAQREVNYDHVNTCFSEEYTIYLKNNLHFTNEGLIRYTSNESTFCVETEKELQENLFQLQAEQEIKYQEWSDLLFLKWKTLVDMNSMEEDVFYLKQKWKKTGQKPQPTPKSNPLVEIYADYSEIFKECAEEWEREKDLQVEEEEFFQHENTQSLNFSTNSSEEFANLQKDLEEVSLLKRETQNKLQELTKELRLINVLPVHGLKLQKCFIKLNNLDKTRLFFEKEFKDLKKLMAQDDLEDFLCGQEWRRSLIAFLTKDVHEINNQLKMATKTFLNIGATRKRKFYPLIEHSSQHLTPIFRDLLSDALPFLEISFDSGEEKLHLMSSLGQERINVTELSHFNTFLKFIAALSIFLDIAIFEKIHLMIFDDIEEYFPVQADNLEAVLNYNTLEKIIPSNQNSRFHLLMRVGQFLKHFIKKHTPGKYVRNNGSSKDYSSGPIQIIYFAKEDLIHSADHYIWIHKQILPEEYITEYCDSYSEIHEITFNN